ncbi:competence protein CoiA family protein [Halomonas sp. H5]|uniref:competence protein CoiA family protein n=1 Tax=Halomonas sp. H5 TaxID=3423910 RepID=UPI003D35DFE8
MTFDAKIPYGFRDDRLLHVSELNEAERGKRCGCVCPECHSPLSAKMGKVMRHHFAHAASDRPCSGGAETGIHLAAKQLIADRLQIPVPPLHARLEGRDNRGYIVTATHRIFHGCDRQSVDGAKLEHSLGNVRPDLIVSLAKVEILVEVAVTHHIEDEKLKRLDAIGLRCIEIDLADIPRDVTPDELEKHVFTMARANWVVNPKREAVAKALEPKLQQLIEQSNQKHQRDEEARTIEMQRNWERRERAETRRKAREAAEARKRREDWEKSQQKARERQAKLEEARAKAALQEERYKLQRWEEERRALNLDGMRQQASELVAACHRIEQYLRFLPSSDRLSLPTARRCIPRARYRMALETIPSALAAPIDYDWMFGVKPLEWKLVAFLEEVYTQGHLRKQEWISIKTIEHTLRAFGYQPVPALHRAEELITKARYYRVLQETPEFLALGELPRPLAAIGEFLGQLASYGMITLKPADIEEMAYMPEPSHRWR